MDLGGIINNQEHLAHGFAELDHEVDICKLVWKTNIQDRTSSKTGLVLGTQGMRLDQRGGWVWPTRKKIPYKGVGGMNRWKEFANKFDMIIWQIPVPSKNKNNKGNSDWLELYNLNPEVKQIAYVHDAHFPKRYPWLYQIRPWLHAVAATHPAGYHSLYNIDRPRALAFTAQMNQEDRDAHQSFKKRAGGWFSLQTFKGWKRVDELVRSIPYMKNKGPKILAGGGIQYYYMTSQDKVKSEYLVNRKKDPNCEEEHIGERIWERALNHGMDYVGYIQDEQREEYLSKVRYLIDPSWSHGFAEHGDHPNRVSVDALINGCVPIARSRGIAAPDDGMGEFFKQGVNYFMIPWNATPKEFGQNVDDIINEVHDNEWTAMVEEGRKIATLWEAKTVAQTFLDLYHNKPAGAFKKENDVGIYNQEIADAGAEALEFFS